jgi:methionine--tRNA ligase beta chain
MQNYIKLDDFKKLELRIAKIIKVEDIPNKDKLYLITVSYGNEQSTIVSGIKPYYKKEELIGKKIVVIYNLEPKNFSGYPSNGMLLAVDDGTKVSLLTIDRDVTEGSKVS